MPWRPKIGSRVFAPAWMATAIAVPLVVAFIALGRWQWDRAGLRQAQAAEYQRGTDRAIALGSHGLDQVARFQRVEASGRFDPDHQFLLDNQVREGRAGFEVLTPFVLNDGRTLIVNRGWVPSNGYRDRLPAVGFDAEEETRVSGRVDELPAAGLAQGRAAPARDPNWPKVTSFPDRAELGAALGRAIEPRVLLLDREAPHGYVRDWRPPGLPAARHWSYAVQWWTFAIAVILLWFITALKKEEPATT